MVPLPLRVLHLSFCTPPLNTINHFDPPPKTVLPTPAITHNPGYVSLHFRFTATLPLPRNSFYLSLLTNDTDPTFTSALDLHPQCTNSVMHVQYPEIISVSPNPQRPHGPSYASICDSKESDPLCCGYIIIQYNCRLILIPSFPNII